MNTHFTPPLHCPAHSAPVPESTTPSSGCPFNEKARQFNPFQDAYMADPSEFVRWSREEMPVFYSPSLDYWVVTRYEAIKAIFRDPVTFSPSNVLEPVVPPRPEIKAILDSYQYGMSRTLVNEDEPVHMARRRVLMEPFTPDHLREHEPMVRRLVTQAIDGFIDQGRVELMRSLLWDVPFSVALHFLGIDDDADRETMKRFSIAHTVNAFGLPTPEQRVDIAHTVGQFWQFSGKVLQKMRETPDGPGWMRYSIRQQKLYPDVVTDSYLHSMMMAIIVAAHESTSFAAANAIKLLLEHPDDWRDICAHPELLSPAVEECLRHSGSIASWRRRTTREVVVEGVTLPAGARLLMVVNSANHDPRHFADPDLFDIRRDNAVDHLTFGFGAHQCLGKNIGRMELQIILGELSRRLPHLRLADQTFSYVHNLAFRGPKEVWVQWNPADNPERHNPQVRASPYEVRLGAPLARNSVRNLVVQSVEQVADGIVALRLGLPGNTVLPAWSPGAHIDIECGDTGLARQYSLCGDPGDTGVWQVAVLNDPDSRGGSAWIHTHVQPGATVRVRGPRNHFHLDESRPGPYVFVAGGIGITPVMAMARRVKALGKPYHIHYSCRSRRAMAFAQQLQSEHGGNISFYVSNEAGRNDFGRLFGGLAANAQVYACGPARMLLALEAAAYASGLPEGALHVEHFSNEQPTLDPDRETAFQVELRNSGLTFTVPNDKTLLEVLRAKNIDVQSDCEEGLCGACEVGVVSGDVEHRDSILGAAERRENKRLMTCCSRARNGGTLVLDL